MLFTETFSIPWLEETKLIVGLSFYLYLVEISDFSMKGLFQPVWYTLFWSYTIVCL